MEAIRRRGTVARGRSTAALVVSAVVFGACALGPDARLAACVDGWNEAVTAGAMMPDAAFDHAWVATQEAAEWNGRYPVCWVKLVGEDGACQDFHADRRMADSWTTGPDCVAHHLPARARRYAIDEGRFVGEPSS